MKTIKIKLFKTKQKAKNGNVFDVFYSYPLVEVSKGVFKEIKTKVNGKVATLAYRTILTDNVRQSLNKDNFPYILTLDDSKTSKDYFITTDKDKEGQLRLTKEGQKRTILVIKNFREAEHYTPEHRSLLDLIGDIDIREDIEE